MRTSSPVIFNLAAVDRRCSFLGNLPRWSAPFLRTYRPRSFHLEPGRKTAEIAAFVR